MSSGAVSQRIEITSISSVASFLPLSLPEQPLSIALFSHLILNLTWIPTFLDLSCCPLPISVPEFLGPSQSPDVMLSPQNPSPPKWPQNPRIRWFGVRYGWLLPKLTLYDRIHTTIEMCTDINFRMTHWTRLWLLKWRQPTPPSYLGGACTGCC